MASGARRFVLVTIILAVGIALVASVIVLYLLGQEIQVFRSVATALVVAFFVALLLLSRRKDDFDVEESRDMPEGVREQEFVAESVTSGAEEKRRRPRRK